MGDLEGKIKVRVLAQALFEILIYYMDWLL
jgi:hypothetical protein